MALALVRTLAFEGMAARPVEVQCSLQSGLPAFTLVGLADKAVSEARERIRAVFHTLALAFPAKRITINLAPAHLPKSGPQFDLPIALALLAAMEVVPQAALENLVALGELSLDGRLLPIMGALPAAMAAAESGAGLLCPEENAPEAAWVGACSAFGAPTLLRAIQHLTGQQPLNAALPRPAPAAQNAADMAQVRGQNLAKRACEISAAGGHNLLLIGPPGAGKSMLAARIGGILPAPEPWEVLETAMVHSLAPPGLSKGLSHSRPFRAPHHSASMAAMIGGGRQAAPGEVSLAHNGVLFLDELPEFQRPVLDALREPLETEEIHLARAEARISYPARIMLIAAANPCRCGHAYDAARACSRAPRCSEDYLGKLSGPLLDRFDIRLTVQPLAPSALVQPAQEEASHLIRARVEAARARQKARATPRNAQMPAQDIEPFLTQEAADLGRKAIEKLGLSARGYHRVLRVARSVADLAASDPIERPHLAEALSLRGA